MEANVVIKVLDSSNSLDFEIPVSSKSGSPLSINKGLSDLTDLKQRSGVQSRVFDIIIDKDIATNYDFFNEAQHHNYKNVDADKDALILINGNEAERGKIRIVGYEKKNGIETVKLLFFGNNYDWTELIKNKTMSDIVWSTTTFVYSSQNIKNSFSNTVSNYKEHVFPLENRGGRKVWSNVHPEDFRPAFFLYKIIERVLQNVGYTFSSNFFVSSPFKKLVVTHFGNRFRHTQQYIDDNSIRVGGVGTNAAPLVHCNELVNGASTALYYDKFMTEGNIVQTNWDDSTAPYNDTSGNFAPTTGSAVRTNTLGSIYAGRFTAPKTGYYKVMVTEKVTAVAFPNFNITQSQRYQEFNFTTWLKKYDSSGNPYPVSMGYNKPNTLSGSITGSLTNSTTQSTFDLSGEIELYLRVNESFEVMKFFDDYNRDFGNNGKVQNGLFPAWLWKTVEMDCTVTLDKKIAIDDTITFADVLDDQYKVLDIINDVTRIFNLYWDADTVLKRVTVEPRNNFYNSIASAKDFTNRLNLDKPIITKYNSSSHSSKIQFSYAEDTNDKYVEGRNKEQATTLAEYTHSLSSKFKEGTQQIKCSVLAPTYWLEDKDSLYPVYEHLAPFTARYWNEYTNIMPFTTMEDNAPRLLNYEYAQQDGDGTLSGGVKARRFRFFDETTERVLIPYVLPHQIKIGGTTFASTDINLFWHTVTTQSGLFDTYWSKTVTEIENGTSVTCYMLFNDKQWLDFKFNDLAYISEPVELKGYWIVERLENYQPENSKVIKVRLLNRIEWDVQTEGTVSYEDKPVGGGDSPAINGALSPTSDSSSSSLMMTATTTDGNGNEINIPMTGENEIGNELPLSL